MAIEFSAPQKIKIVSETFIRQQTEFELDRPAQAWQWMNQTRTAPEQTDWVRPEVSNSWSRCLDEYHLPLGNFSNWDNHNVTATNPFSPAANEIVTLVKQLSHNFHIFLKEAGIMMVLTATDGRLLYVLGENCSLDSFISKMYQENSMWSESVIGNNGIGTAAELKKPIAFQGMEHFLSVLHPFTTVGYPLLDEENNLKAVIGLVCDHKESMNSLFAFLRLICVLLTTDLPIALNQSAQERVLEKIPFKQVHKQSNVIPPSSTTDMLDELVQKAVRLQTYKIPILITGESGVGKDHFVNLVKNAGHRKNAPLIAINCASIPQELIESELFGYESGSFTGARSQGKAGKFLLADKGTLFLDEIGDMSFNLQSTLLRVLETSEFMPVGGTRSVRVDVQVVAATNVNLAEAVEAGRFRRDLYYRLNGAQIHLPPLRQRPDKKQIIAYILQREMTNIPHNESIEVCSEVMDLIEKHPFPGNIRQLINVVRAMLYTSANTLITVQDLPKDFLDELHSSITETIMEKEHFYNDSFSAMSLTDWEIQAIKITLRKCEGNISLAAKRLGITRTTLYKKIDRFGLIRQQ